MKKSKKYLSLITACVIACSSAFVGAFAQSDRPFGDANLDNNTSITDVTYIQKHIAEILTMSEESLEIADVNGDGSVTIADATMIQKYIAGIDPLKPTEPITDPPTTVPPTTAPVTTVPPTTAPPTEQEIIKQYKQEILKTVNQERAKNNLPALTASSSLEKVADLRAKEITKVFDHTRPNGTSCFTAVKEAGISYMACGENIANGYSAPSSVMKAWMDSEGHRKNILNTKYHKLGVGICKYNNKYYWVQIFTD